MTRIPLATFLALALLPAAAMAGNGNGNGNGNTTTVCHVTGNGSINTLSVNQNAISSHLAHGDFLPIDWFEDLDGDGYGSGAVVSSCTQPAGYTTVDGDCDDADASVNPGAAEVCDGIDNNCDGVTDDGCIWGDCPTPTELSECTIDTATGAASCTNGNPVSVVSTSGGLVLRMDMTDWTVVAADVDLDNATGYSLHIGNSPSNDGWDGDGSQFYNDSEVMLFNTSLLLFANDAHNGILQGLGNSFDPIADMVTAVVCDSYFGWESSTASWSVNDPRIFQIDGDEPDGQAGGLNDQVLWIALNRVIGHRFRSGSGASALTLTFGR